MLSLLNLYYYIGIHKKIDSIYSSNKLFINRTMDRFEKEQMERNRESFAIRSSLILMDLEQMLEKVKKIEMQLMNFQDLGDRQVSKSDFFKPDEDSQTALPPKKKMRI